MSDDVIETKSKIDSKRKLSDEENKLLLSRLYASEDLQLALKVRKGEAELALFEKLNKE